MIIRAFNGSKSDLQELIEMFIDLFEFDYNKDMNISYAKKVGELYKLLYKDGSICNFILKKDDIAGFMLLYPDEKQGIVAQSLYVKKAYRNTVFTGRVYKWLETWVRDNYKYCSIIATNDKVCKMYDNRYKKLYSVYKFIPEGV